MKVPFSELPALIKKTNEIFVYVKLNEELAVYLRIAKSVLNEYFQSHRDEEFLIDYEIGENNELLIGVVN